MLFRASPDKSVIVPVDTKGLLTYSPHTLYPLILFVEDNAEQAQFISSACQRAGFLCYLICKSGHELLDVLDTIPEHSALPSPYRIVIDFKNPLTDGIELASAIREKAPYKNIAITLLSHALDPTLIERARLVGCSECLTKFDAFQDLPRLIQRWTISSFPVPLAEKKPADRSLRP